MAEIGGHRVDVELFILAAKNVHSLLEYVLRIGTVE
jgi:hypothetical protein